MNKPELRKQHTVSDVAKMIDRTPTRVRQIIIENDLKVERISKQMMLIPRATVVRILKIQNIEL